MSLWMLVLLLVISVANCYGLISEQQTTKSPFWMSLFLVLSVGSMSMLIISLTRLAP